MRVDEEGYELNDENQRVKNDEGAEIRVNLNPDGIVIDESGEPLLDESTAEPIKAEVYKKEALPLPEPTLEEQLATMKQEKEKLGIEVEEARKAHDGAVRAIQEEREKRREIEALRPKSQGMSEEEYDIWLNEPLTRREAQELEGRITDEATKRSRPVIERASLDRARTLHKDYDETIKLADEVLKQEPYLRAYIDVSDDPEEVRYKLARFHPNYLETVRQQARKEITEQLGKPRVESSARAKGESKDDLSDINLEAYMKLTPEQKALLPQATRERILGVTVE